jgi:multiple sugar transport system substrate-binding protein
MRRYARWLLSCFLVFGSFFALSAETTVVMTVDSFFSGVGKMQDAIDSYAALSKSSPDVVKRYDNSFRHDYWVAMQKALEKDGITTEGLDWSWAESLIQRQVQSALAKTGPDIWVGETQMPGFAVQGLLEPFPPELEKKVRDICKPAAYKAMEVGGRIYGITPAPGITLLYWNKDLVKQAGLDPEKAPATWAELQKNCDAVTKAGKGKFFGGGMYVGPNFGGSLRYMAWFMENGGGFVDSTMKPTLNSAANVETVKFIRELDKNMPVGIAGDKEDAYWNAVNQGKIAYFVDGPWRKAACDEYKIPSGYAPLPLPSASSKPVSVGIGMTIFGVTSYSKNKEAAFKVLEAMLDKGVQDAVVKYHSRPPVLKAYENDPAVTGSYLGAFYKAFSFDVYGLPTFAGNSNAKIWDILHNAVTKSVVTSGDVKKILDAAQKQALSLSK